MKKPALCDVTQNEMDELLALAKEWFPKEKYYLLKTIFDTFRYIQHTWDAKNRSIRRLLKMIFGSPTEKTSNLLKQATKDAAEADPSKDPSTPLGTLPKKSAGHGRNGVDIYRGATVVRVEHPSLKSGDWCPECITGKVYRHAPKLLVQFVGQPPLAVTVYQLGRLRCHLCDAVFAAPRPAGVSDERYDASAASMIALLKYGSGMPFFRLQGLQANLQVPLSDATLWDIVEKAVRAPHAVYVELTRQAAQGDVLHNDDTPMKILALMGKRAKDAKDADDTLPNRKAVNTSGIVAIKEDRKIVLFFTGKCNAGENLDKVLAHRAAELPAPIQMCDGLLANLPKAFNTVLSNCLAHGRRKVADVVKSFPEQCRYLLEILAQVYRNDAYCQEQAMSKEARLSYHQEQSGPLMDTLKKWMAAQLDERQVEPNSGLGKAFSYMLKRWTELTLFLRQAGAPLDNNIVERALKKAILHRKNSYFYKTLHGAEIGDVYMSLIYTCQLCHANPFEYLKALMTHADDVVQNPHEWLPWNYHAALAQKTPEAKLPSEPDETPAASIGKQVPPTPFGASSELCDDLDADLPPWELLLKSFPRPTLNNTT